jgi:hypothetical protein
MKLMMVAACVVSGLVHGANKSALTREDYKNIALLQAKLPKEYLAVLRARVAVKHCPVKDEPLSSYIGEVVHEPTVAQYFPAWKSGYSARDKATFYELACQLAVMVLCQNCAEQALHVHNNIDGYETILCHVDPNESEAVLTERHVRTPNNGDEYPITKITIEPKPQPPLPKVTQNSSSSVKSKKPKRKKK